jgi:hypothetical protein
VLGAHGEGKGDMDLLTRADAERPATPGHDGIHVSMPIPTHRTGAGVGADRMSSVPGGGYVAAIFGR